MHPVVVPATTTNMILATVDSVGERERESVLSCVCVFTSFCYFFVKESRYYLYCCRSEIRSILVLIYYMYTYLLFRNDFREGEGRGNGARSSRLMDKNA